MIKYWNEIRELNAVEVWQDQTLSAELVRELREILEYDGEPGYIADELKELKEENEQLEQWLTETVWVLIMLSDTNKDDVIQGLDGTELLYTLKHSKIEKVSCLTAELIQLQGMVRDD